MVAKARVSGRKGNIIKYKTKNNCGYVQESQKTIYKRNPMPKGGRSAPPTNRGIAAVRLLRWAFPPERVEAVLPRWRVRPAVPQSDVRLVYLRRRLDRSACRSLVDGSS